MIDVEDSVIASNEMAELVSKLQEERSGAVIFFRTVYMFNIWIGNYQA